jgi:hypothetical protein
MLRILKASAGHSHDLGTVTVVVFLALICVRNGLELGTGVNSIYFDGARNHFLGIWTVLSARFLDNLSRFLPRLSGVRGYRAHSLLNLRIILVFRPKFINFSLQFKFVSLLCGYVIFITISCI